MTTRHWFGEASPDARTAASVAVETADAEPTDRLVDWVRALDQTVLGSIAPASADAGPASMLPLGARRDASVVSTVQFVGDLCEWTSDAVGWLCEVVVEGIAQLGGTSPIVITVSRADPAA